MGARQPWGEQGVESCNSGWVQLCGWQGQPEAGPRRPQGGATEGSGGAPGRVQRKAGLNALLRRAREAERARGPQRRRTPSQQVLPPAGEQGPSGRRHPFCLPRWVGSPHLERGATLGTEPERAGTAWLLGLKLVVAELIFSPHRASRWLISINLVGPIAHYAG